MSLTPTMPAADVGPQVTAALMKRYTELIYKQTGIRIPLQKTTLLSNRIRRRLRETGLPNFETYFARLSRLPASNPEWDKFLQEVTTHETYLFRDEAQWEWLRREHLPSLSAAARRKQRPRTLRVWSAAASTGDEAYTAACCIASGLQNHSQWSIQIVGTDIGVGALAQASTAVFGERAMRLVPPSMRTSYFKPAAEPGAWQARPVLTAMVTFRQHNLMDPLNEPPFDLIFLKNVLIYFDRESKRTVVGNVLRALKPGGILIAGAAEGISDLLGELTRVQSWLFRRPDDKQGNP